MTEIRKLRVLLLEARRVLGPPCEKESCGEVCAVVRRIDAALAEPVLPEGHGPCEFCKGRGTAPVKAAWSPRDVLGGDDGR